MTEVLTTYDEKPVGRPTFLTVLCILTFIGSGLGLISNARAYFTANSQAAMVEMAQSNARDELKKAGGDTYNNNLADKMVNSMGVLSPQNLKNSALAGVVAAILCLLGAYLMWGLKKTGFYSYLAGTIVGIIAPVVIFGFGNIFGLGFSVFGGFFGILFVVLYALNLKHMR